MSWFRYAANRNPEICKKSGDRTLMTGSLRGGLIHLQRLWPVHVSRVYTLACMSSLDFEMLWVEIDHLSVWPFLAADECACESFLLRNLINLLCNKPHIFSGFKFSQIEMSQSHQAKSFLSRFWILPSFRGSPLPFDWIFPFLSWWEGSCLEYDRACYSHCAKQRVVPPPASSPCWEGGMNSWGASDLKYRFQ